MTEQELIKSFYKRRRSQYKYVFPNVHVGDFESDILAVTKSGYVDELEIKCSKADLLADFKKTSGYGKTKGKTKHDLLLAGELLPNRFWFYLSKELGRDINIELIPPYIGVLTFDDDHAFHIIRSPKRLHDRKIDDKMLLKITSKFVFRYNDLTLNRR